MRYRAADAARQKALEVVVRRVERVIIDSAFDGHVSQRFGDETPAGRVICYGELVCSLSFELTARRFEVLNGPVAYL